MKTVNPLSETQKTGHDLQCEARRTGYEHKCTCKPIEMSPEDFQKLRGKLNKAAEKDLWVKHVRTGIQVDIFNAFQEHRTGVFECFLQGPNQIFKSTGFQELLKDALRRENKYRDWGDEPLHILVLTPKQTLQEAGFQKRFLEYNAQWFQDHIEGRPALKGQSKAWASVKFDNGDYIQFETFDAGKQYIEAVTAHMVICDEGMEHYDFYPYLFQRLVHHRGVLAWSMIPPPPAYDMYKNVFEAARKGLPIPKLRKVLMADESHYIAANGLDMYEHCRNTYPKRDFLRKVCGQNVGSGSMVYDELDEEVNIIPENTLCQLGASKYTLMKVPEEYSRVISIDWANTNNPDGVEAKRARKTVGIYFAIVPPNTVINLPDNSQVISEADDPVYIIYNGYESKIRKLATEHAEEMCEDWEDRGHWVERFQEIEIDAATGTTDGTSDRSVFQDMEEIFIKHGCPNVRKATNKWRYPNKESKEFVGHDLVHSLIKRRKILFLKNGKTDWIIEDMLGYENDEKTGLPRTYGDDTPDAIRYFINDKHRWSDPALLNPSPYVSDVLESDMMEALHIPQQSAVDKYINKKHIERSKIRRC